MRAAIVAMVAAATTACGPAVPPAPLDGRMAGSWWGSADVAFQDDGRLEFNPTIAVVVADHSAEITGLCPEGQCAPLMATGDGAHAAWHGSAGCPSLPHLGCPVVLTYSDVVVSYDADFDVMVVDGVGTASQCASSGPFAMSFLGLRQ